MSMCKDINKLVEQKAAKPKKIQKKMPINMLGGI